MSSRVVVIGDSLILGRHLQGLLARLGIQACLLSPRSCPDALPADVAAVLLELQLRHANGFQLLRQLVSATCLPVILVSGSGRASDREWGLRAGAAEVLQRPLDCTRLAAVLQGQGLAVGLA